MKQNTLLESTDLASCEVQCDSNPPPEMEVPCVTVKGMDEVHYKFCLPENKLVHNIYATASYNNYMNEYLFL